MSQNQQTYSRAANAALAGMIVQLGLAIVVALLGVYAESPALRAATLYFFGGAPIWLILTVLYHQHRLERTEALEAEQLARADARTAALFEEAGQQLQQARNRLETLYRFVLPIVSVLVAGYLLAVGGVLLYLASRDAQAVAAVHTLRSGASPGVIALLSLVVGFVGFLVSRYVAGMTQVREWETLRGGAAYLMGNAAVAVILAIGAGLAMFGGDAMLAWLAIIVPAIMVLLGVEIMLGFVLGLYRPRRPGEATRPAFDSRLLGWLTRPESMGRIVSETINYQFGFEISSSWFYRLLARAVTPLLIVALIVLVGMTSLVFVAPQQQAVITTFGRFERVGEPGLHVKWPWPISRAEKFDAYRIHQVVVGSKQGLTSPGITILWTNEHAPGQTEEYLLTAPTRVGRRDVDLGGDSPVGELAGAEVAINFRIRDGELEKFARNSPDAGRLVTALAERRVTRYFSAMTVDELLTQDRALGNRQLRAQIQQDLDERDSGIEVVYVGLVGVHPPQEGEVASKFHEQIGVIQQNEIALEEARRDAIATLAGAAGSYARASDIAAAIQNRDALRAAVGQLDPAADDHEDRLAALERQVAEQEVEVERLMDDAGGRSAQLIHEARAYRWQHALENLARADRYAAQFETYEQAPRYYLMREYLDMLADTITDRRKYIFAADQSGPPTIRIQLDEAQAGFDFGAE